MLPTGSIWTRFSCSTTSGIFRIATISAWSFSRIGCGVPAGATITRAVLHWGVLYDSETPRDTVTLNGTSVRADVTATVSGDLCWGDSATVGYTADVTPLVTGNGTYRITDPVRGLTRPDSDPEGRSSER